ncbi:MAG: MFS transporter [Acetobacteraceae bacterium]|nr:MFS transporter [Acetobacteraceae bacterium]
MAIGVTVRTAFSLLMPPLIGEFGWDRGLVAGAFSFGFLVSAALSPLVGRVMDRHGPRIVIEGGVCLMVVGLLLSPAVEKPWQLYATLGVLVGSGANLVSFTAQSLYLPNWFVRHRGLAISIAFSGASASGPSYCYLGCRRSSASMDGARPVEPWVCSCFSFWVL